MPDLTPIFHKIATLDMQAAHSQATRKQEGITYTPPYIARQMVELLAPHWSETIHEPSCGRGVFVFALVEYWLLQGKTLAQINAWAADHLWASDIDPLAIADLQGLWREVFQDMEGALPLNASVEDGLFGAFLRRHFDIILGNPPYVRIQHLEEATREKLRGGFISCEKGNVDLYYAFFEDALRRGRRVCYIMPNSWFHNASAKALRQLAKTRVEKLVDFGSRLVFAPVRAYVAIALAGAGAGRIGVRNNLPCEGGDWEEVDRGDARFSSQRWTPLLAAQNNLDATLGDAVHIVSGIATLADKVFILTSPTLVSINGVLWVEQIDPDFQGHTLKIPASLAPRLIKATKSDSLNQEGPRILCPYDQNWNIIGEDELATQAPDLLAWLQRRRSQLDSRDKGKTANYETWYAYGRRQGFWAPQSNEKVLLVPQMGNGALTTRLIHTHDTGRFLFTSGFVLRAKAGADLEKISKHLESSSAWAFVEREGKAWAGAGDYRTIGARSLRQMPMAPSTQPIHLAGAEDDPESARQR